MNVKNKTDEALIYAAWDIDQAISANPRTDNLSRYLIDRDQCDKELVKRRTKRLFRANLKLKVDALAEKANDKDRHRVKWWHHLGRQIEARNNCSFIVDCFRSANWRLASFKLYDI